MKRGILKINSLEDFTMTFISEAGDLKRTFKSSRKDFRKWFCNSSLSRAIEGVPASYDGKNNLLTDEWDLRRRAESLSGIDFQLSHHFC